MKNVELTRDEFLAVAGVCFERLTAVAIELDAGEDPSDLMEWVESLTEVVEALGEHEPLKESQCTVAATMALGFSRRHSAHCDDDECVFRFLPSAIAKLTA